MPRRLRSASRLRKYARRLVAQDLGDAEARGFAEAATEAKPDISSIFDLGASAKPTDIARDKDKLIGEAVWANYLRTSTEGLRSWRASDLPISTAPGRSARRFQIRISASSTVRVLP